MLPELLVLVAATFQVSPVLSHREHKVHNIVLYPERHSWCQTTAIKQVVASPGYEPATIDNHVCVGACYSYSIPKTQPAEPGELIGPYCDSCQPVDTRCYHVTLHADGKNVDGPRTVQKRVQIITNCTCLSCDRVTEAEDCTNTDELPSDLFALAANTSQDPPSLTETSQQSSFQQSEDLPELLHFKPTHKNRTVPDLDLLTANHTTKEQRYELNAKLINLLKSIRSSQDEEKTPTNLNYDRTQLRELLEIIEGKEKQLSDKNLMEFVNFVNVHNSEDLELDLSRLKEVLVGFQKEQELAEKHRKFGLGDIGKFGGIEGSHLGLGHYKGSHIGMGIVEHVEHHHLGEKTHVGLEEGHLVQGPHGSLAFAPDANGVEQKLDIESHLVKPNEEGLVLHYENHPKSHHKKYSADGLRDRS